uniref:vasorin-like n=1 Tax=Styela clava TaxID=7725 RepID=UPI0019395DCC|nr:vasorin-like [Styela clava]
MGITCTQNATVRTQCRLSDGYCDCTIKKKYKQSKTQKGYCFNIITLTVTLLLCLPTTVNSLKGKTCPSQCSCTVESIVFCNNKGLTSTPLGFTSAVEKLYLFNNNITTIPPRSLQPFKNLKILDISGNRISNFALWKGIFNRLTQLENIMLQDNQITKITADLFRGLNNLARIYLQNNEISYIEPGAFSNLSNLVELKLRNNKLMTIPRFEYSPNLLLLDLGYNRFRQIPDMTLSTVNVEQLFLQNNRLTQLRTSIFDDTSHLSHLDISSNRLTAVPQFIKSLVGMRTLNMSLNTIKTIPQDTFTKLTKLKVLAMRGMALKSLPDGVIPPRVILNVLDITDNDWDCGCDIKWMPQYIRIFRQAFVRPESLKCSSRSRLRNRVIEELTEDDFDCSKTNTLVPPLGSVSPPPGTPPTTPSVTKTPWSVNPCDVYPCFHGGSCYASKRLPKCRCTKNWTGSQCQQSLTTPTTTTRTTTASSTMPTTTTKQAHRPSLLINTNSVTENSVEIILPITEKELLVSIAEVGQKRPPKEFSITPKAHPFTVKGLEPGRFYNICIHLPLVGSGMSSKTKDTLCGSVKTSGRRIYQSSVYTDITVVPSPGLARDETTGIRQRDKTEPAIPGTGDKFRSGLNPETTPTESTEFQILLPAVGAGIGGLVIVSLLILFCYCYRQKRLIKMKQQNNGDYTPGSPLETTQSDMEMSTQVHHHVHNHYTATGMDPNGIQSSPIKQNTPNTRPSNAQSSTFINNSNSRISIPNKPGSLSGASDSSGSVPRYADSSLQYPHSPSFLPPSPPLPVQNMSGIPPQVGGRAADYQYRNNQNNSNNSRASFPNNHCGAPLRRYEYEPEILDDMQPLVGGTGQYYGATEGQIYPVNQRHGTTYMAPSGPVAFPQTNSRSAFQPIQSPRNTVRTPTSETAPIITHAGTGRVIPSQACFNRNIINDGLPRYHDGVQVV